MTTLRALFHDPADATPAQRRTLRVAAWLPVVLVWVALALAVWEGRQ